MPKTKSGLVVDPEAPPENPFQASPLAAEFGIAPNKAAKLEVLKKHLPRITAAAADNADIIADDLMAVVDLASYYLTQQAIALSHAKDHYRKLQKLEAHQLNSMEVEFASSLLNAHPDWSPKAIRRKATAMAREMMRWFQSPDIVGKEDAAELRIVPDGAEQDPPSTEERAIHV